MRRSLPLLLACAFLCCADTIVYTTPVNSSLQHMSTQGVCYLPCSYSFDVPQFQMPDGGFGSWELDLTATFWWGFNDVGFPDRFDTITLNDQVLVLGQEHDYTTSATVFTTGHNQIGSGHNYYRDSFVLTGDDLTPFVGNGIVSVPILSSTWTSYCNPACSEITGVQWFGTFTMTVDPPGVGEVPEPGMMWVELVGLGLIAVVRRKHGIR